MWITIGTSSDLATFKTFCPNRICLEQPQGDQRRRGVGPHRQLVRTFVDLRTTSESQMSMRNRWRKTRNDLGNDVYVRRNFSTKVVRKCWIEHINFEVRYFGQLSIWSCKPKNECFVCGHWNSGNSLVGWNCHLNQMSQEKKFLFSNLVNHCLIFGHIIPKRYQINPQPWSKWGRLIKLFDLRSLKLTFCGFRLSKPNG